MAIVLGANWVLAPLLLFTGAAEGGGGGDAGPDGDDAG